MRDSADASVSSAEGATTHQARPVTWSGQTLPTEGAAHRAAPTMTLSAANREAWRWPQVQCGTQHPPGRPCCQEAPCKRRAGSHQVLCREPPVGGRPSDTVQPGTHGRPCSTGRPSAEDAPHVMLWSSLRDVLSSRRCFSGRWRSLRRTTSIGRHLVPFPDTTPLEVTSVSSFELYRQESLWSLSPSRPAACVARLAGGSLWRHVVGHGVQVGVDVAGHVHPVGLGASDEGVLQQRVVLGPLALVLLQADDGTWGEGGAVSGWHVEMSWNT